MDCKCLKEAILNNDIDEVEARFELIENHVSLFSKYYGQNSSVADMIAFIRNAIERIRLHIKNDEKDFSLIDLDVKYIFSMLTDLFKYDLESH